MKDRRLGGGGGGGGGGGDSKKFEVRRDRLVARGWVSKCVGAAGRCTHSPCAEEKTARKKAPSTSKKSHRHDGRAHTRRPCGSTSALQAAWPCGTSPARAAPSHVRCQLHRRKRGQARHRQRNWQRVSCIFWWGGHSWLGRPHEASRRAQAARTRVGKGVCQSQRRQAIHRGQETVCDLCGNPKIDAGLRRGARHPGRGAAD